MEKFVEKENFEEYEDPALYDKENASFTEDIQFLMKWAEHVNGPIIDLACGTGRATIPLAQKGFELIGVDIHSGMLKQARKKTEKTDLDISWIEQDCTKLDLGFKSSLIYMVGNSFQHFLTNEEQDQVVSSVAKHLEKGGVFIFGTRFPSVEELLQPEKEEYWRSYQDEETGKIVEMSTICSYDALKQIQRYITIRRFKDENGNTVHERRSHIQLRYVFPKEMERLFQAHGFHIEKVYKDWNETLLTNESHQMIYVCSKV